MTERKTERLSPAEHEELVRFSAQVRRCLESGIGLAARIRPARETSHRGRARSRLDCVLHDYISPAIRSLEEIVAQTARHLEGEGDAE